MKRAIWILALLAACSSPAPATHGRVGGAGILSDADRLRLIKSPENVGARSSVSPALGSTPIWTTRTVFIQSDVQWNLDGSTTMLTDPTQIGCDPGDASCYDGRDGTSINAPFRSITGALNYYDVQRPRDGLFLDVVLLADNRAGDWDAANKIVTHGRVYWQDEIFVGASTSMLHSVTFRGPRGGWKHTTAETLVSHSDETYTDPTYGTLHTGCVKLKFSPDPSLSCGSYHISWLRSNGKEAVFPMPCTDDDHGGGFSFVCGLNDAVFVNSLRTGDVFYQDVAAVLIHTSLGDGQMRVLHIYGEGAGRVGDRTSASPPTFDPNYRGLFSHVQIGRSWWDITGGYTIGEDVRLSDNATFRGGSPRLRGVSVEGHLVFVDTDGALLTNSSQLLLTEEAGGYMAAYTLPLSTTSGTGVDDPDYPINSVDFEIGGGTADSYLQLGEDVGASSAHLRIMHGMGIRHVDAGIAIKMFGRDTELFEEKYNVIGIALTSGQTALWAADGAIAAIDDADRDTLGAFSVGFNISGTDLDYRAGNGNAVIWGPGPTRWAQSTSYTSGQRRMTDPSAGGNGYVYQCITSGTSSGSGSGPTGTASDITDGTAHWKYVAAGALRDSHGYNGYLTHRLDKSANGYATDDDSVIRDRSWEASGYTTGR